MQHSKNSYFRAFAPFLIFTAFLAGLFGLLTGAFLRITMDLVITDVLLMSGVVFNLTGVVISVIHVLKQGISVNYKLFWIISLIVIPFAMLFYLLHINQLPPASQ